MGGLVEQQYNACNSKNDKLWVKNLLLANIIFLLIELEVCSGIALFFFLLVWSITNDGWLLNAMSTTKGQIIVSIINLS